MKNLISMGLFEAFIAVFASFKRDEASDEGKLPNISFKTVAEYVHASESIAADPSITIGINASKAENLDVLKHFRISKSMNGAAATTAFDTELTGTDGDVYSYDFSEALENVPGQTHVYTFAVTNRDGRTNRVTLTVTIQ